MSRRRFIESLSLAGGALGLSDAAHADPERVRRIVVAPGGRFSQVGPAMDSIVDAGPDRPWVIDVMPGVYDLDFRVSPWVTVRGSGPLATVFEGAKWEALRAGPNTHLCDFGVRHTSTSNDHGAIRPDGQGSVVYLDNIHVDQYGPGSAVFTANSRDKSTWWIRRMRIRAEGTGFDVAGTVLIDDAKVALFGDWSGWPHVGLRAGPYSRIYLNNSRIGTGYWHEWDGEDFIESRVSGDDDVVGIWVPVGVVNTRVEVHGLESFCRNETTSDPGVAVNVLRIEDGWLRAFGCFGQSEVPMDWSIGRTVYQSGPGKFEHFACRFSSIEGRSFGSALLGVQLFTAQDDGYVFDKLETGLHCLDTSGGSFTLHLRPGNRTLTAGEEHVFKKMTPGNAVTVDLNGGLLDGSSVSPVLTEQYEVLRIVCDGRNWLRV